NARIDCRVYQCRRSFSTDPVVHTPLPRKEHSHAGRWHMGGEVDQNIVSSEGFTNCSSIEDVQGDRRRAGGFELSPLFWRPSNRGDSMAASQQLGHSMRTDDTSSTRNEYPHDCWPC